MFIQQRLEFQEVMRDPFATVIQELTDRPGITFMSDNQQHPDMMCEAFILGPSDLVEGNEMQGRLRAVGSRRLTAKAGRDWPGTVA